MTHYFVGVDLGQAHDYSTVAVVERAELRGDFDAALYAYRKEISLRVRKLERIPLGTPYPDVSWKIVMMTHKGPLANHCHLVVDGTGVGRPVVDLLRQPRPPATLMPVIVTGGMHETTSEGYYHVPKRDLILGLKVTFQKGTLQITRGLRHANEFLKELAAMQVKVTTDGREQYGAWREGSHDDLVFAVALACWAAGKASRNPMATSERWWTNRYEADAAEVFRKVMEERKV